MVQPEVIVRYWAPILILSAVVIVGMILFGTFGMLVTGQNLKVAIQSGFSLTQIGEFAFIIATLGMSLGVLNEEIYPIVVAVSVITTFTTPYFIRMADPFYEFVARHLPARLHFLLNRYSDEAKHGGDEVGSRRAWMSMVKRYLWRIVMYGIVLVAISLVCRQYLMPALMGWFSNPTFAKLTGTLLTLALMAPFLLALCLPPAMNSGNSRAHLTAQQLKVPRVVMMVFRLLLALAFIVREIAVNFGLLSGIFLGIACFMILILMLSKSLIRSLHHIESKFMDNLNERELRRTGEKNNLVSDLHLAYMHVGYGSPFVGERLMNTSLRRQYGVSVVTVQRGQKVIVVPSGDTRLFPGDTVGVIGTDEQISAVLPFVEADADVDGAQPDLDDLKLTSVVLGEGSVLVGKTLATADVRRNYSIHVVTLERDGEFFDHAPNLPLLPGDRLWIVGTQQAAALIS